MIDKVPNLNRMLLFAFWIGRDTADILEIHAPFHPGSGRSSASCS
jgi:hypothetical protein